MTSAPFRPAREIAITARRTARDDPANYDSSPPTPAPTECTSQIRDTADSDILESHPRRPGWWPQFTAVTASAAAGGAVLFLAHQHVLGVTVAAGAAAAWGIARIAAFYDRDLP